jgi:nitrogen-specific signal transduction histidine kinase
MQKPQSSAELRRSLHHAVECAERALTSERKESLAGIRRALAALSETVEVVDAARLEWFDITPADERELRALVQRVQALVQELLVKVESWQAPTAPSTLNARATASARWLN